MKKSGFGLLLVAMLGVLSGCGVDFGISTPDVSQLQDMAGSGLQYLGDKTNEFIENNEYAQQAQQTANQALEEAKAQANSALEEAKNQTNQLGEQVKNEANRQYQQLKEDTKAEVKNAINQKIDKAFERI